MQYATRSFVHLDLDVKKGDALDDEHPMVVARPDLFSSTAPSKRARSSASSPAARKSPKRKGR